MPFQRIALPVLLIALALGASGREAAAYPVPCPGHAAGAATEMSAGSGGGPGGGPREEEEEEIDEVDGDPINLRPPARFARFLRRQADRLVRAFGLS